MQYFIKGNYYFDIDLQNQLRIAGPKNHLFLGLAFPQGVEVEVVDYRIIKRQLRIDLVIHSESIRLPHPLVTDIRTLRSLIEPVHPHPLFSELVDQDTEEILPESVEVESTSDTKCLLLKNRYRAVDGDEEEYGARIMFPKNQTWEWDGAHLVVKGEEPVKMRIETITNITSSHLPLSRVFKRYNDVRVENLKPFLGEIFVQSGQYIEHMVRAGKTSSFEYGTIFPRDWIESADLGKGDLTPTTINYMYSRAMQYISEEGEGWHEDLIGQARARKRDPFELVDRKMIDIEPHYILGMRKMSKRQIFDDQTREKLSRVARYILRHAQARDLITFKPKSETEYYPVGNWRDSTNAFAQHRPPIAPYDVNCVFYPVALDLIRTYKEYFGVDEEEFDMKALTRKWHHQKQRYRLYHPDGILGYSLGLHGPKHKPLPIAHLDESYDMFYGKPSMEEVMGFATKLLDPEYFYTPVGPLLVAADEEEFTTKEYHGKVIWPKQAAFAVAGLMKQLDRFSRSQVPEYVMLRVAESVKMTCEACFRGWQELKAVPELYYYDESEDRARLYTDQPGFEAQMSIIQLWSSVGARRIIREYEKLLRNYDLT